MAEIARDFYVYGVTFSSLAAAAQQTGSISIQADSNFVLQKMCYHANIANASQEQSSRVIPLASLIMTDTGSGRQSMNQAIDLTTFFGTGESPFILPQPKIFMANTLINFTILNYDAAETYNIYLSLIGYKSFQG